ncbi:MAG: hypothetical protein CM15mP100_4860 [Alphaproteobacteria bacterium]|nr:MAG: hypothetical protein CM15mP100_4860 [Alphaproteobacteria bacterium]
MGAWLSNFSIYIPTLSACRTLTGPYDIAVAGMEVRGIVTNTPAVDAFRGAGRPEANYVLERLMDHIADVIGMDRVGVRQVNLIKPEQIPYKMVEGGTVDSGDMPACWLRRWRRQTGWDLMRGVRSVQNKVNGAVLGCPCI